MRFVLDTNTCIYALKRQGRVVERLQDHRPEDLAVTILTLAELWFGEHKSARPSVVRREMDGFLEPFEVLLFDHAAATCYARVRFELERIGRPVGERDLLTPALDGKGARVCDTPAGAVGELEAIAKHLLAEGKAKNYYAGYALACDRNPELVSQTRPAGPGA